MSSSRTSSMIPSRLRTVHVRAAEAWRTHERNARKRQRMGRISLATPWFRATWLAFFLLRVVLFVFLAGLSVGYWFMSSMPFVATRMTYNLPGPNAMLAISGLFGLGAVVCGTHLAQMVRCSVQQQRLAFRSRPTKSAAMSSRPLDHARTITPRTLASRARALYRSVFGPRGLLGIEHPFFFQLLVVREVLEIGSQGYQAYLSSTLVPRRWPNDVAAVLLALNCWTTLLVNALGPTSLASQRVLCLAVDIILDFAWSVLIPAGLLAPYIAAYDPTVSAFADRRQVDYVWMLGWQMEIQQLCLTSGLDVVSSMMPFISMLMSARTITRIVDERRTRVLPDSGSSRLPRVQDILPYSRKLTSDAHTLTPVMNSTQASLHSLRVSTPSAALGSRIASTARSRTNCQVAATAKRRCVHVDWHAVVFFALGVAVIGVHAYAGAVANRLNADAGCLVQLRPWFTNEYACAYAHLNCYTGRTGDASDRNAAAVSVSDGDDVAARLAAFQPTALLYLVVSHAPALAVPASLARFRNLRMLTIYNATITDWPNAAAFTVHSHAHLRQLSLVRTNLSALPDALTRYTAPFVIVDLIATNLTTVPDSISANWLALQYFAMEHGELRALPPAIASMRVLERLSVCGNDIDALPATLPGKYAVFNVAQNPLRALPTTVRDTSALRLLTFERTLVAKLPPWVTDAIDARGSRLVVAGHGSPYCSTSSALGVRCAAPSHRVDGQFFLASLASFLDLPSL